MKKLKLKKINLKKEKKDNKKKTNTNVKNTILSILLIGGIIVISIALVFALYIIISSPDFDKEKLYSKESSVLYYNDGKTELARLGQYDRVLVNYEQLPQVLVDAIIATEDSRFFQHNGLDMARFAKASVGQLIGNDKAGGASTLTMQVIKQIYSNKASHGIKGIVRKFQDIYMAVFKLESNYTKEEIIEFYVNSQWFGSTGSLNNSGFAGVEQACQNFFGKSVSDISLAEASIIAGMFQNPGLYNPYTYPNNVRKRQKIVLTLMVNHGYITEEEKNAVLDIPIESLLIKKDNVSNGTSRAAIDYVIDEIKNDTGYDLRNIPMKVVTTIDKNVQDVLNKLENGEIYKFPNDAMQEGMAITNMENGGISALSGGRNYGARGTNRATTKRQPGSTAKILFDYGPYIEYLNGSPASLFLDEETTYSNGTAIKNADGKYNGLMTMRDALAASRNIPALRAFKAVYKENPDYIKNFVKNLGIDYGGELYESASIGGFDGVSPVQMSAAYAAYGRGGYYIKPYSYTKIEILETGKIIEKEIENKKVSASTSKNYLSKEKIKEIVFNKTKVKDYYDYEIEFEFKSGKAIYEVEFETKDKEYDIELDALSGNIIKYETKNKKVDTTRYITKNKAKSIALNDAKVTNYFDYEIEFESDDETYEISFDTKDTEYEYVIDAKTGKIIEREIDRD